MGVSNIETTHVLGLAFSVGTIGWFDLRLVGVCMRRYRVSETFAYVRPWMFGGFALMMITRAVLVWTHPVQATVYAVAVRGKGNSRLVTPAWMVLGGLAFVSWLAVGVSGRFIAFYQ